MKTVYAIEDETIIRNMLSDFFETNFKDLELVGMSADGAEGFKECLLLSPDLVILDIYLPEQNGLEVLQKLKRSSPGTKVLVFTGNTSRQSMKIAIQGKADGYINKVAGLEELEEAIYAVERGEQYFSSDVREGFYQIREEIGIA